MSRESASPSSLSPPTVSDPPELPLFLAPPTRYLSVVIYLERADEWWPLDTERTDRFFHHLCTRIRVCVCVRAPQVTVYRVHATLGFDLYSPCFRLRRSASPSFAKSQHISRGQSPPFHRIGESGGAMFVCVVYCLLTQRCVSRERSRWEKDGPIVIGELLSHCFRPWTLI